MTPPRTNALGFLSSASNDSTNSSYNLAASSSSRCRGWQSKGESEGPPCVHACNLLARPACNQAHLQAKAHWRLKDYLLACFFFLPVLLKRGFLSQHLKGRHAANHFGRQC